MIIGAGALIYWPWFTVKDLIRKDGPTVQIVRPRQIMPEQDHAAAVQWARDTLSNPQTVILDTETTDIYGYICEIAAINVLGEIIVSTIVDPRAPISDGAFMVHGISNLEAAQYPDFGYVWQRLRDVRTWNFVAWNAPYDYKVINLELRRMLVVDLLEDNWQCAMRQYGAWKGEINPQYGDYKWYKLEGGHRALGDCIATLARIREMADG